MKENSRSKTRNKFSFALFALFSLSSLLAVSCSDDSGSSGGGGEDGTVKTVSDLGTCLSAFEGDTYRVEEMEGDYRCEGGKWVAISSLGECTDSLSRAGVVKKEKNKGLDGHGTSYVCRDSAWTPATDVEIALGNACTDDLSEELRTDSSGKKKKTYICANGTWREASAAEKASKALCTKNNENSFATDSSDKKNVKVYVCKDSLWTEASAVEMATRTVCGKKLRGTFAADSAAEELPLYVCDSTDYGWAWRIASEAEGMTRLLCDETLSGDTVEYHVCTETGWERDTTSSLGTCTEDRSGEVATEENPFRMLGVNETAADSGYVCDGTSWRNATAGEKATGRLCTEKVDGDTLNWYVCDASINDWTAVMTTGLPECNSDRIDSVATEPNPNLKRGDSLFVCAGSESSEYAWKKLETSLLGTCDGTLQDSVRTETNVNLETSGKDFVCDAGKWQDSENYDIENGVPCTSNLNDVVVGKLLCEDGEWREASDEELDMGAACTESSEGTVSVEKSKTCRNGEWEAATDGEKATGKVCAKDFYLEVANGYVCDTSSGKYAWREGTASEKANGKICSKDIFLSYANGYVCDTSSGAYGWRTETTEEKATGKVCTKNIFLSYINGYACDTSSGKYAWREGTTEEKAAGFVCTMDSVTVVSGGYTCKKVNSKLKFSKSLSRELYLEKGCSRYVNDSAYIFKDSLFRCVDNYWKNMSGTFLDVRDNKVYRTVSLGTQTWMAENLNYDTTGSFCHNNDETNCSTYGRLYLWGVAMDSAAVFSTDGKNCGYGKTCTAADTVQGVCPIGWHLPNTTEWNTLAQFVAKELNTDSVGYALKSTSGWSDDENGSDAFGFGALPAGWQESGGNVLHLNNVASFWSSSSISKWEVYWVGISPATKITINSSSSDKYARSVRCVENVKN